MVEALGISLIEFVFYLINFIILVGVLGKFLYRQIAFVELTVHELVKNRLVDHGFESFRGSVCHGAACRFDDVGEHEDCCFHALRARTLVAEIFFLDFFASFLGKFCSLVVEELDKVLGDEVQGTKGRSTKD